MARPIEVRWPGLNVLAFYEVDLDEGSGEEPTWRVEVLDEEVPEPSNRLKRVIRGHLRFFHDVRFRDGFVDPPDGYVPNLYQEKADRIAREFPGAEIEVNAAPEEELPDEEEPDRVY